ncbi:MAG: phenylacetate-CoA ligase [Candidatus Omnitrophota bacterium]|jgi:phenylacetate-CoA ligase
MLARLLRFIELKTVWKNAGTAIKVYEACPQSLLTVLRIKNFKNTIKRVAQKSIFYRQRFQELNINPQAIVMPNDLGKLYTNPVDLQERPMSHFTCDKPQTSFETTGTTSKSPKRVLFSYAEIEDIGRVGAAGLWRLGIRPLDRVASSFDYSFWVSGPTLKASLENLGAFHVEAGRIDPQEFYNRIKPYGCNIIVADPGWMVNLSQIAEVQGAWMMKMILIGGENLTEKSRKYIEQVWQCPVLLSYGQTEAFGMIGVECMEQNGYHLNDMDLWVEIIDPDENGYGELVYSTLRREVMPLLRYKSGDVTKIINEPCACGAKSIRLAKLRGRVDDMVVTGAGNIAAWMLNDIIEALPFGIHEWQLRVGRHGIKDALELWVEPREVIDLDSVKHAVLSLMKEKMSIAYQGIDQGLIDFDIKIVVVGELRGNKRKVKRIIDSRNFD